MNIYAEVGGVDYKQIQPFKDFMREIGLRTLTFPNRRQVIVESDGSYCTWSKDHRLCQVTEGLGNKNWIAEWMYLFSGTGNSYYSGIGIDNALMAANDLAAKGALPIIYTDEAAAGDSEWFNDANRRHDLGESYFRVCQETGMALVGGESPSLRYLIRATEPVKSAPVLSGCATGIISPASFKVNGSRLRPRNVILAAPSTGLHSNGASLVIGKALGLPEQFLTKLPNGKTLGEEALIPTRSYVQLVEALQQNEVQVSAFLPGTGDGVAKLAFDKRPLTYRIHTWWTEDQIPLLFRVMHEVCEVPLDTCLTTFNWGAGWYIFVDPGNVQKTMDVAEKAGYPLLPVGTVEEGPRQTVFGPYNNMVLPPPGE
ncbi:MAG: hypothetical protein KGJ93_00105 [Patescibacteria group bacterium]|nr:hypothetical protein [Patescibacteria group bacterium]